MDMEKVIKVLQIERECVSRDCDRDCGKCDLVQDRDWLLSVYDEAIVLLKEQEEQIKNRDESLEKAREEIKWLRGMLKEQEAIEGTIEETRGEWPDETLPVSRNKEREHPCDYSRRNKA